MKKSAGYLFLLIVPLLIILALWSCNKESSNPSNENDIWDIDKNGIPMFIEKNYIELSKIQKISKFRSSVGHDYSDAFEHCRSMKHYFEPKANIEWSTVKIYSPVTGKITRVEPEWAGTKIEIASDDYPAFRFSIFHISLAVNFQIGNHINSGDLLGTHIGSQTMSDISVIVNDPTRQGRMVSYFDVITEKQFNEYFQRGVATRADMIISKSTRDANPLTCNGDVFVNIDTLQNWVILK